MGGGVGCGGGGGGGWGLGGWGWGWGSSVSNALDESMNMDMGKSLLSKAEITRSINPIVANSVECFSLMPY